jgi:hypothetical protein
LPEHLPTVSLLRNRVSTFGKGKFIMHGKDILT